MNMISKRGSVLALSPIRSLMPLARKAKLDGVTVHHLNIGQPDIKTPPAALEKLKHDVPSVIGYGPSEGLKSLRKAVSAYYKDSVSSVEYKDIYITTGASEAILFSLIVSCDPGQEVIIPEPFYANYVGFTEMAGVKIVPLSTSIEKEFNLPPISEFKKSITKNTKAIMLCNPGNPTGQLYDKTDLLALAKLVKEENLILIVDEVYREFCYDDKFFSVLSIESISGNVIVIDSISKLFSGCGARVGFLVTRNKKIQETVLKYAQLRLCPPYFGQKLAEYCYEDSGQYIREVKEEYRKRRDIFYTGLQEIEGIKYYKPHAAFYNIVELPVEDSTEFCSWLLTDFRKDNETIMLAPAGGFYRNQLLGKRQVRIAYVLNEKHLKASLDYLKLALSQYNK